MREGSAWGLGIACTSLVAPMPNHGRSLMRMPKACKLLWQTTYAPVAQSDRAVVS